MGGGDVEDVNPRGATTHTASGVARVADNRPRWSGEREGEKETEHCGAPPEHMPARRARWADPEG